PRRSESDARGCASRSHALSIPWRLGRVAGVYTHHRRGSTSTLPQRLEGKDMTRFPITFKVDPLWRWLWRHGWEPPVGPEGPLGEASVPDPVPWRSRADADSWREAVEQLVEAVQAKDVASRMKDSAMREATAHRAQAAIEMVLEDWCGTPPRRHPWPW